MPLQSKRSRSPVVTQITSKWFSSEMSINMGFHVANLVRGIRTVVTDKFITKRVNSGHLRTSSTMFYKERDII